MAKRSNREVQQRLALLLFATMMLLMSTLSIFPGSVDPGFLVPSVQAFAAAKNKRRGKASGGGGKGKGGFGGFGKPPPTLNDVLSNIKTTRLPKDGPSLPCPCGSKNTYAECCGPLHETKEDGGCTTPIQVLQSRYSAFCYRNVGHVIATTHPECRDYRDDKVAWAKDLDKEGMFDSFEFVGLEILDDETETNEDEAFMAFQVRLKGRSLEDSPVRSRSMSSIEGEETIVSERSRFLKDPESGIWKYAGGDVRSTVKGLEDTTLNA